MSSEYWRRRLSRGFDSLQEYFHLDIASDPLFHAVSKQGEDGHFRLQDFRGDGTSDALHIMSHMMKLAVGSHVHGNRDCTEPQVHKPDETLRSGSIYTSARLEKSQIRLLNLLPGRLQDPIRSTLLTVDSLAFNSGKVTRDDESTEPTYDALSYVWASEEDDVTILVNDVPFNIWANLNHALHCLRLPDVTRALWVDAICINQDDEKEKSEQVCIMNRIYSNADNVHIYLGPESDESTIVMDYLTVDDIELLDDGELFTEASARSSRSQGKVLRLSVEREETFLTEYFARQGLEMDRVAQAAYAFFCRPWWTRMWVVQEAKLAKCDPVWHCGWQSATMQRLRDRLPALHNVTLLKKQPLLIPMEEALGADTRGRRKQFEELMGWTRGTEYLFFSIDPKVYSVGSHSLSMWLDRCTTRHSTDPRDRIFALVSMLEPLARVILAPDYSVPSQHVFLLATAYIMTQEASTRVIDLYSFTRATGKPSWSLDFTRPFPEDATHWFDEYIPSYWYAKKFRTAIYNRRLVMSGIEFDVIHVASNIDEGASDFEILDIIRERDKVLGQYWHRLVRPRSAPSPGVLGSSLVVPPVRDNGEMDNYFSAVQGLDQSYKDMLQALVRTDREIPGAIQFICEMLKVVAKLVANYARSVACEDLKDFRKPSSRTAQRRAHLRVAMSTMTRKFLDAATFKLLSLTSFIDGFKLEERAMSSKRSDSAAFHDGNPQLGAALRAAPCQEDLDAMKGLAQDMAHLCHSVVIDHIKRRTCSPAADIDKTEKWLSSAYAATKVSLHEIIEGCTCGSGAQEAHRAEIETLLHDMSQEELMFKHVFHLLKKRREAEYLFAEALSIQRRHTAMFTTTAGFFGFSFQHNPGFEEGDKVVLLNGLLAPAILKEEEDSGTLVARLK